MVREIPLTKGYTALVDDEDYERVSQFNWRANVRKHSRIVYAYTNVKRPDGTRTTQYLHRFILDAPEGVMVDHIDGDGLRNTRDNLRLATPTENQMNARKRVTNTSGFIGVSWDKAGAKWRARIGVDGKRKHLGLFADPVEAAKARDRAAIELHDEFAVLNFPNEEV
jgi:hypothetical protein